MPPIKPAHSNSQVSRLYQQLPLTLPFDSELVNAAANFRVQTNVEGKAGDPKPMLISQGANTLHSRPEMTLQQMQDNQA